MRGDVDGHRLSVCGIILVGIRRAVSDRLDRMVDVWFFRQNARMNIKRLTRGNIDTRTEEQKADAWLFFRQNDIKT